MKIKKIKKINKVGGEKNLITYSSDRKLSNVTTQGLVECTVISYVPWNLSEILQKKKQRKMQKQMEK